MSAMFDGDAVWFGVPAAVGTAVFVLKLVLMLIGGDADGDLEFDVDGDGGFDTDDAFSVLSIQGVAAFAAGFGWGGLGGLLALGWPLMPALGSAVAGGVISTWALGLGLKAVYDLQSSGNVRIDDTLGAVGEVYAEIPPKGHGSGQVRVVVEQRQRIYDAVSEGEGLPRSTRVRVVSVEDPRTLCVAAD